ncbi:hypothetical protein AVEN_271064-1 [Araneus ventricosus]|uniref:Tc1-like transposase DDE domain-containing protein n=1 Tax=Araneus ventricosus TaxID=182803 RepID=A0A4Y2FF73_ARAVE|nr:hypothetical protein AVEN_271064-1 [Araneus ventricosus]
MESKLSILVLCFLGLLVIVQGLLQETENLANSEKCFTYANCISDGTATQNVNECINKLRPEGLQPNVCPRRPEFAIEILNRIDLENDYLNRVCFSGESTFHVSGMVNRHNVRIWSKENPHVSAQLQRDSPKVNVWCDLMHNKVIEPFFFTEKNITANVYLDLLQLFITPQLEEFQPCITFQQDGAPPHWGSLVQNFLDETFPDLWIGRDGPTPWHPRSPGITPLEFFFWGYIKDRIFSTPITDVKELKDIKSLYQSIQNHYEYRSKNLYYGIKEYCKMDDAKKATRIEEEKEAKRLEEEEKKLEREEKRIAEEREAKRILEEKELENAFQLKKLQLELENKSRSSETVPMAKPKLEMRHLMQKFDPKEGDISLYLVLFER